MNKKNWILIDSDAPDTWSWKFPSPPKLHEFRRQRWSRHGKRRRILSPLVRFSSDLQHPWVPGTVAKASQRIPLALGEGGQFINVGPAWHLTHHTSAAPLSLVVITALNHSQLITIQTLSTDNTLSHQEVWWAFHWLPFMLTSSFWDYQLTGHSQS